MKKKTNAPPPPRPAGPLVIVDLRDRVPAMSDDALTTLHFNAQRLAKTGNERERTSATALMPVIESELAIREAAKPVRKPRAPAKKRVVAPVKVARVVQNVEEPAAEEEELA